MFRAESSVTRTSFGSPCKIFFERHHNEAGRGGRKLEVHNSVKGYWGAIVVEDCFLLAMKGEGDGCNGEIFSLRFRSNMTASGVKYA